MAERRRQLTSSALEDVAQKLRKLPGMLFCSEQAAELLGIHLPAARELLAEMECDERAVRVCRDGWVLTCDYGQGPRCPELVAYLHDMMQHLGAGYYLSYAAAARRHGASHHGVMRQHVNVETADLGELELRSADGPADLAVSFHRIDPLHGRPTTTHSHDLRLSDMAERHVHSEYRDVQLATIETALLDMVERPDRSGGMHNVATLAQAMLFWRLLDPVLLAEASDRYESTVARRTGSMLQQLRGLQHRCSLRPLWRHVRSRSMQPALELHSGKPDASRKPDRWGVTCKLPLDPDF